ncbi:MAG: hydrogenase maturation protease [Gallionella sp.]|nr:hydrogenase maturation protease [Gallionella sp.]
MTSTVLVFAIGNESRGDDALGPVLLRKLGVRLNSAEWKDMQSSAVQFELLEDFQLQVEHVMDMQNRRLVLFIDAGMDTPPPFSFYRVQTSDEPVLYSHALAPESLLKVYEQFHRQPAPDAYVLCIRGEGFELGESLSPPAQTRLSSALEFTGQLLLEAEAAAWDRLCTQKSPGTSIRSAHETNNP